MTNSNPNFEENVKKSFKFVKDDISTLKSEIEQIKEILKRIENEITNLKEKDTNKSNFNRIEANNSRKYTEDSIGSEGVKGNRQQATTGNNARQSQAMNDLFEPAEHIKKAIDTLTYKIESLSDREFSIFLTLYELGLKQQTITYFDVAQKLKISDSWVRTVIGSLIKKGIPINKERFFNKQSSLFVPEELNSPYIIQRIIKARQKKYVQKTLLDI